MTVARVASFVLLAVTGLVGQPCAAQNRWQFAFAPGPVRDGVHPIRTDSVYDPTTGFGWEPLAPTAGAPAAGHSSQFSVALAEGDYKVTVTLGSAQDVSDTSVMAESRRLMLQHVMTGPGETATRAFTVNIRNAHLPPPPANAPGGTEVRLGERERLTYTWDERLTLEFSGASPKLMSLAIEPVQVPRLFLLGDSTVTDQAQEPYASWGQMLPRFFGPGVAIANHAQSGETLKSFLTGLRLDKVLSQLRPGDWVFIQFGHNDEKEQWPQTYAAAQSTYRSYLRVYIDEVRRRGANPVLVTSPQRRMFDPEGHIINNHGDYPEAVRMVGAEQGVAVIDLGAMSIALYESLGPTRSPLAFPGREITHNNDYGAYELAKCVVRAVQDQSLPLARYLAPDIGYFDPAKPDPPEAFRL